MTDNPTPITAPEPTILHSCGRGVPGDKYGGTLGASVIQYPGAVPVVTLDDTDGDGGLPNQWWELSPEDAEELAEELLHHAAVARDLRAQVN